MFEKRHTDMDIVLRKLVVAVTMVLVLGSKLATVDFGCHDMDDSVVDQTWFLFLLFVFVWDSFLSLQRIFRCCFGFKTKIKWQLLLVHSLPNASSANHERTETKHKNTHRNYWLVG